MVAKKTVEGTIQLCFFTTLSLSLFFFLGWEQKREKEYNISIYNSPWQGAIHSHLVVTAALSLVFSILHEAEAHMLQSHTSGGSSEHFFRAAPI